MNHWHVLAASLLAYGVGALLPPSGPYYFIGVLGGVVALALKGQHDRLVALEKKNDEATVVGK